MRLPISAIVITFNEEKNIERCLTSLVWAEEILVIDGGSTDKTVEICKNINSACFGKIRILERPWDGFRNQRNFSIKNAKNDWVLVVDSDEKCSSELAAKVQELLALPKGPPHPAYRVRRTEYFLGKEIQHGIWSPSYQDRFFHRAGVQYVNDIHEYPKFAREPSSIDEPLEHDPGFNPEHFLQKMNKYTSVEARDRVNQGMRTNAFRLFFAFPAMFLKTYFYYEGYKDGIHGFVISLLEGVSRVVRHIKIWQYSKEQKILKS